MQTNWLSQSATRKEHKLVSNYVHKAHYEKGYIDIVLIGFMSNKKNRLAYVN